MGILNGKVAIVTGAGAGLGRSHALALAAEGARIVVNDLGTEWDGSGKPSGGPADKVVKEIKDMGSDAVANYESVSSFQGAKRMVDMAVEKFGRLDILVNNAGILRDKMTFNMSEEEWDLVIAVHLKGTFNTGRWAAAYWRELSKAGKPVSGRIINTVSHAAVIGSPGQPNYSAAKGGIATLTMVWARELEKMNVTSNAVCPMARTRMTVQTDKYGMFKEVPKGQFDEMAPENISPLVVYLASDDAKDITGHVFSVRGGKLELFNSWQLAKSLDIHRKWDVKEIHERIRELGNLGMPQIVF
ncbi:MAG: SDR family NAD(P)-dependent oxidoreductase [Chloroflexi bacterium]|nr:SDR family NAD(P)-dependent oxidoreductase [Chloroflexota bacterium]